MSLLFANAHAWQKFLVTLVVVMGLAVVQPWLWGYVKGGAEAIHNRRTEEQQLKELIERLAVIEQKHTEQAALLDGLTVIFPHATATSQVVDRLEVLADRQSVELSVQNIAPPTAAPGEKPTVLSPTVVSVQVKGSATRLLQYIDAVEHVQELAVIQSWDLAPAPAVATLPSGALAVSPGYTLAMNILFYLQP